MPSRSLRPGRLPSSLRSPAGGALGLPCQGRVPQGVPDVLEGVESLRSGSKARGNQQPLLMGRSGSSSVLLTQSPVWSWLNLPAAALMSEAVSLHL